jgi:transposase
MKELDELRNENIKLRNENIELKEEVAYYKEKIFGRRSEKEWQYSSKQPELFNEGETYAQKPEEIETQTVIQHRRVHKGGRKPLSDKLQRRDVTIDLEEKDKRCPCCGEPLTRLGEENDDITEKLEYIPAKLEVIREHRPKYVCEHCHGAKGDKDSPRIIREAPATPSMIPGSIATSSLLAAIIVMKFCDAIPYYRQEKQYERIGALISRQDMANWQIAISEKLQPLMELLKALMKTGPVLRMDETTVEVMREEGREDTQKSYMWLGRGGPIGNPIYIYEYHPTRAGENARSFLDGFHGFLQTDGYPGYDSILKEFPAITHAGCFAHARRKFMDAQKSGIDKKSPAIAIGFIRSLYQIEDEEREKFAGHEQTLEQFIEQRRKKSTQVLNKFKKWLEKKSNTLNPQTLFNKAVSYTLNQWDKLIRYLDSPDLTPDNNLSENAVRPFVIGRKNWLFFQCPKGAKSACAIYSLIETAKANLIEPLAYLTFLFDKAPLAKNSEDWFALLPWNSKLSTG